MVSKGNHFLTNSPNYIFINILNSIYIILRYSYKYIVLGIFDKKNIWNRVTLKTSIRDIPWYTSISVIDCSSYFSALGIQDIFSASMCKMLCIEINQITPRGIWHSNVRKQCFGAKWILQVLCLDHRTLPGSPTTASSFFCLISTFAVQWHHCWCCVVTWTDVSCVDFYFKHPGPDFSRS